MRETYEEAKQIRDMMEGRVTRASETLKAYPRNAMGITPDEVKFSSQYRRDRVEYDEALSNLRKFNKVFTKAYAAEIRAERNSRFATA